MLARRRRAQQARAYAGYGKEALMSRRRMIKKRPRITRRHTQRENDGTRVVTFMRRREAKRECRHYAALITPVAGAHAQIASSSSSLCHTSDIFSPPAHAARAVAVIPPNADAAMLSRRACPDAAIKHASYFRPCRDLPPPRCCCLRRYCVFRLPRVRRRRLPLICSTTLYRRARVRGVASALRATLPQQSSEARYALPA